MMGNYFLNLLIIACIYSALSMSLNLAIGYTGLLNLAHVAFYAVGAYASALLAINLGVPFWLAFISAGALSALFGYLLAYPTVRFKGDYLVLGTLGFAIITESFLKNWTGLTRGPLGIPGIPKPELFGFSFGSLPAYAFLVLMFAILSYVVLRLITDSPFGRILQAIRDDEIAAKSLGKDTFLAKAKALSVSACIAGLAGSLYAHYISFIDPSSFGIIEMVLILSMVLIGGTGSLAGSVAGAVLLVLLPEPLRFLPLPSSLVGGVRQALYALLLVLVVLKRPQGILGEDTLGNLWRRVKS